MLARPRFDAAIAFYLIYIAGIVFFAVAPAFGHGGTGWKTALTRSHAGGWLTAGDEGRDESRRGPCAIPA